MVKNLLKNDNQNLTVFISYAREDMNFAKRLWSDLHNVGMSPWLDKEDLLPGQRWKTEIVKAIRKSTYFIILMSSASVNRKGYLHKELTEALDILNMYPDSGIYLIPIRIDDCDPPKEPLRELQWVDMFPDWEEGFKKIIQAVAKDQPKNEKLQKIVQHFSELNQDLIKRVIKSETNLVQNRTQISQGIKQQKKDTSQILPTNEIEVAKLIYSGKIGEPKQTYSLVNKRFQRCKYVVDNSLLPGYESDINMELNRNVKFVVDKSGKGINLLKAKPSQRLFIYGSDDRSLNVAILVSGGIVPGINAVIDAIVQRHFKYAEANGSDDKLRIYGFHQGFNAFDNYHSSFSLLVPSEMNFEKQIITSQHVNAGGSIIGTSRTSWLESDMASDGLRKIAQMLRNEFIKVLYVIGGDGSMRAAHHLWECSLEIDPDAPLTIIGIPKSMNNDIFWVSDSLGSFASAQKAYEIIEQLHIEVLSNPRICVCQLFGSTSGFMVCKAVALTNKRVCDVILIPELPFSLDVLVNYILKKLKDQNDSPHALIVMAEGAIPVDCLNQIEKHHDALGLNEIEKGAIHNYYKIQNEGGFLVNQISDALRTASLKLVSQVLQLELRKRSILTKDTRVFTNEPRHLLRAIAPTSSDKELARKLGEHAVDAAIGGYTDVMIANWNADFLVVPLTLVTNGMKRLELSSDLLKSAIAKTGQPEFLK
jgi:6-phosphofructokinase 1